MTLNLRFKVDPRGRQEQRLFLLATIFLVLYAAILTLAQTVRVHSWQAELSWKHWMGLAAWLAGFSLIFREVNRRLPDHDPYLLPVIALLSGWGLMTIWRLDSTLGMRQTIWLVAGFLIVYVTMRVPDLFGILRRYKYIWLFSGLLLTISTFFFGSYPGGSGPRLWLGCCGLYFQPSEPLKILLIAYLAAYLADRLPLQWSLPHLLAPTLTVAGTSAILLIAQRDLGTATLLIVLYTLIIFLASGRRRILGIALALILAAGTAGYATFDVIRLRVNGWLNPWLDPSGESFQIVQALISTASGRVFGTGPGLGSPTLVPVSHSDFIATALSEETGFMGVSALILLFCLLFFRGLTISMHAKTSHQRFLAGGLSAYFATQAIFILGGNLRLLPLTGVTLPFVSYGGSSLITAFLSAAVLLLISNQQNGQATNPIKPRPYLLIGGLILTAFAALTLLAGWWSVIRSENLQFRPDNLRWTINERYVTRGSLLDRNNQPIAISEGEPGDFQRVVLFPDLGNTIGYNHPLFGKASLEASLDGYLSGIQGNSSSLILEHEIIYSQPPPGLDVRLSLDLNIQTIADQSLKDHVGALVLMNASTGEILAIASHPSYDPGQIDQKFDEWEDDASAPLLNRVTQGSYPPGPALGPFLYSTLSISNSLPATPTKLTASYDGRVLNCSHVPDAPISWESVVRAGCPGAINDLALILEREKILGLLRSLGFYETTDILLPAVEALPDNFLNDPSATVMADGNFRVTPLQMALAASTLTNQGEKPVPRLAVAVKTPHQGWVVLPSGIPDKVLPASGIGDSISALAGIGNPIWFTTARAASTSGRFTWFVGGTIPSWRGSPLAIALVLEEDNPDFAESIGKSVLQSAMTP